jgi:hypothetical protein
MALILGMLGTSAFFLMKTRLPPKPPGPFFYPKAFKSLVYICLCVDTSVGHTLCDCTFRNHRADMAVMGIGFLYVIDFCREFFVFLLWSSTEQTRGPMVDYSSLVMLRLTFCKSQSIDNVVDPPLCLLYSVTVNGASGIRRLMTACMISRRAE